MATAYSTLLGLALPVQGELSGTWGDTVNNYITNYLDSAVAGTQTLSTDADVTLTKTTATALGSTSSQYAILNCTGARTALRTITAPAASKIYVIINQTTGGFGVKLVGAGPTTGITVAAGTKVLAAWNGADFVAVAGALVDLTSQVTGVLPVANGGTNLSSFTSGGAVYATSTSALTTGTLPIASGGTGATTGPAALVNLSERTGATGSIVSPVGTTAQRDGSPATGYFRFNTDLVRFEGYTGSVWAGVGGGATGGGSDQVFVETNQTVTTNYTLTTNFNAMSAGPVSINTGVTVTIPTGATWSIV